MKTRKSLCVGACVYICVLGSSALGDLTETPSPLISNTSQNQSNEEVFKMFHFFMPENPQPPPATTVPVPQLGPAIFPQEFRTIDGTNNNLSNPTLGSANTPFLRTTTIAYGDGHGTPAGANEPNTRQISNLVDAHPNVAVLMTQPETSYWWAWGQFMDHDLSLTPIADPAEPFDISIPQCDPQQDGSHGVFDPNCTGTATITFSRSAYVIDGNGVRQQLDASTHYLDGSMVYGSDPARAQELRTLNADGQSKGQLKVSTGNLLPFNVDGFPNQPSTDSSFFLAGDVRANENSPLTALHTLFVREHNFWAVHFATTDPCTPTCLDDEGVYQRARAVVVAEIENITYSEFLPFLIGARTLTPYTGYNENVNPCIANVFTNFWRFGHSLLGATVLRLDHNNQSIGSVQLQATFFNPSLITSVGIEPFLRGLAQQRTEAIDGFVVDGMRNFVSAQGGGFDLVALNIQRGRDHGLPRFNQIRSDYGLAPYTTFGQLTNDQAMQTKLASVYASVNDVDAWVGMAVETHQRRTFVGPTLVAVLKDQFQRLRDGDRFWYQAYLDANTLSTVQHTKLSDIIVRNSGGLITTEVQPNVFQLPRATPTPTPTPRP